MMSEFVIEVGDADFESAVVERSADTPVVVDFWASWCGPCRALGPLLERLAEEHRGAFVLAKVNVDHTPGLSAAFNIRSIPTVLGFRDRQVVAEFVGALPEAEVREFLSKVLPSEADRLAAVGDEHYAAGQVAEAEAHYRRALALEARCGRALVGLARIQAGRGEDADAVELLERVLIGPLRQEAERLAVEIRVRQGGGGDERALRERLAADPTDLAARCTLAQVLARAAKYPEALTQYVEILRSDRSFRDGAVRKAMLDIFELLGPRHETTEHFRSELAKVLFS